MVSWQERMKRSTDIRFCAVFSYIKIHAKGNGNKAGKLLLHEAAISEE